MLLVKYQIRNNMEYTYYTYAFASTLFEPPTDETKSLRDTTPTWPPPFAQPMRRHPLDLLPVALLQLP